MQLGELIDGLPITVARGDPGLVRVGDVTEDSRTAVPGSLFVARPGLTTDGRSFAQNAADAGASAILTDTGTDPASLPEGAAVLTTDDVRTMTAVLAERLCGNPSRRLLLVGVTGTNGKSTVTHLVHQLLNRCGVRCGMIGTVQVDDGTEIAPSSMTTPPAPELSRTLATMVEAGCDAAVMEVSSHAIDQGRTSGLSFDACVFTNVTGDHLDYHGTFETYLATKRGLFRQIESTGADAILNADDPGVAGTPCTNAVRCSLEQSHAGGWVALRAGTSVDGERLALRHGDSTIEASVPMFGAFNAMNAMQAVAAAWAVLARAGVDEADRAHRLGDALSLVCAPPGRLEPMHSDGDDVRVFVDYAHTHDAFERVLSSLRAVMESGGDADARLWCVFGCGGDRDKTKRPLMGRAAVRGADRVVLTCDNPRTEPLSRIIADVLDGLDERERGSVAVHIDRSTAVHAAIAEAAPGDVVLIAGKGHETTQEMPNGKGGVRSEPFNEREVARGALAVRRASRASQRTRGVIA